MKFSIKDRLVIPSVLPTEGSYTEMIIRKELIDKVVLTQDDIKKFDMKTENGKVAWDEKKATELDVELTELEHDLLKESLIKLDKEKKISEDLVDTYKKVVIS